MITDRPYKKGLPYAECKVHLRKQAAAMFDPDLIEIFIRRDVGTLYLEELGLYDEVGFAQDGMSTITTLGRRQTRTIWSYN